EEPTRIRRAELRDVDALIAVHFAAVHELGAAAYPQSVLDAWSPASDGRRYSNLARAIAENREILLVDEVGELVVGWAAMDPDSAQIMAVYVHPLHSRRGVGARLLRR